jgi:hypothetical protein
MEPAMILSASSLYLKLHQSVALGHIALAFGLGKTARVGRLETFTPISMDHAFLLLRLVILFVISSQQFNTEVPWLYEDYTNH